MRLFQIYIASCFLMLASTALAADPIAPLLQKQTLLDKKQKSIKSGLLKGSRKQQLSSDYYKILAT